MPTVISVQNLLAQYRQGEASAREVLTRQLAQIRSFETNPAWISLISDSQLEEYLRYLENSDPNLLPLYGIPFAIKDNIDLAGLPTTAACPDFAYQPEHSAVVVQRLINAGAVPLGKTNMDQFATGLVGTRSPYGICHSVFSDEHISGGSSSGSAVAVAEGQVAFALGTDTAGSGRIPAAFNNLVGLKPSRGLLSNTGMLRACRSLDCISIFALSAADARLVFDQTHGIDAKDEYSRELISAPLALHERPRVAVPLDTQLEFFGDTTATAAHRTCLDQLSAAGWDLQSQDFSPFLEAARLLYQGPWVAERQAAFGVFVNQNPDAVLPLIRQILEPGNSFSAADVFRAQYRLQQLRVAADQLLAKADFALTPTSPTHYRIDQLRERPLDLNTNLGTYTNFMNLLDMAAIAVPVGFTERQLPWGITLFAPAFHDYQLLGYADRIQHLLPLPLGKGSLATLGKFAKPATSKRVELAVCGAHMEGLSLNEQLLERDGILVQKAQTARGYRLYALAGGPPYRPGLVRDSAAETAIELEVWSLDATQIGSLLEMIPAPLGLGKVELADGHWVNSFICEPWGIVGAEDISHLGGWRTYLEDKS